MSGVPGRSSRVGHLSTVGQRLAMVAVIIALVAGLVTYDAATVLPDMAPKACRR